MRAESAAGFKQLFDEKTENSSCFTENYNFDKTRRNSKQVIYLIYFVKTFKLRNKKFFSFILVIF